MGVRPDSTTRLMPITLASSFDPLHHVVDQQSLVGQWMAQSLPLSVLSIVACGVLACVALIWAAGRIRTGPESDGARRYVTTGRLAQIVEAMVVYLRDQMLVPVMGETQTRRYLPFLMTMFFFILSMNLFGIVPIADLQVIALEAANRMNISLPEGTAFTMLGGCATANLLVTGALATICFFVVQIHALTQLGLKGWLEHLCGGKELLQGSMVVMAVVPIIFVVEFVGLFVKPCALAIRLFANMVGGHTLLATLLMFGGMAMAGGLNAFAVGGISLASGLFAIAITFMELFVAFLQAFVFMFLTAVFISEMTHHGDHDEHADSDHAEPAHA